MLTCRELLEFLLDYEEQCLAPQVLQDFEWHLARCVSCRNYLDSYRRSTALLHQLRARLDQEVGQDVPEELVQAILKSRSRAG